DNAGNIIVAFSERPQVHLDADVYVRRFSPQGDPLGDQVRVNEYLPGDQWIAAVAASPRGGFLVVWQSELQDGDLEEIYARRFLPDGEPAGPEFRVNTVTRSAQRYPYVAADRHGNYAVAWSSFREIEFWDTKLRLFRSDGTPIADEVLVNQTPWSGGGGPLAFAPNDTLLVGFSHWTFNFDLLYDAHYRRFAVAPGSEVCRVHDGMWDCQFGERREQTVRSWFPLREGETPLLGDVDGDGRDDPCAFGGRRLRCDLDHAGRPAELEVRFDGRTAGVPWLVDLDGNGRDELCVLRGRSLYCARAENGARLRFRGRVGLPGPPATAGDIDGDGRDDFCAFVGGRFRCDTAPVGG
ncbi:MAG: FG-GAP-like repeat-containing protein, partial [Chloroflexi bacterium]|nr:FG-GAP-like repeat-containing protein [Chloroflexota bacterium]